MDSLQKREIIAERDSLIELKKSDRQGVSIEACDERIKELNNRLKSVQSKK